MFDSERHVAGQDNLVLVQPGVLRPVNVERRHIDWKVRVQ